MNINVDNLTILVIKKHHLISDVFYFFRLSNNDFHNLTLLITTLFNCHYNCIIVSFR